MDYVVYNNADTVGVLNKEIELSVFTNKPAPDAMGGRVWLLFGQGNPRRYFLRLWFQIDGVGDGSEHRFRTRLSGSVGNKFDPIIELTNDEWFKDLKREQGNFAFGFNSIKNPAGQWRWVGAYGRIPAWRPVFALPGKWRRTASHIWERARPASKFSYS